MTSFFSRRVAAALIVLAATPATAAESGFAGPYLAARQASLSSDYSEAASYFRRAIAAQPDNLPLMESGVVSLVGKGDILGANEIALKHEAAGGDNQIADLVMESVEIVDGSFARAATYSNNTEGLAPLLGGLTQAWALLGDGRMSDAIATFDTVAEIEDFASFAQYHRALALASVGDFESANAILSGETYGPLVLSPRGIEAHAQILAQLERPGDALDLLREVTTNGFSAELEDLKARLEAGEAAEYDFATSAREGFAEVLFNLAGVLNGRTAPEHVLIYARLAAFLRPDHAPANLMAAELLEDLNQFELAAEAYGAIATDDPAYVLAELGRAGTLFAADRKEASVEVLTALSKSHGDLSMVYTTLGDTQSRIEDDEGAIASYTRALELNGIGNRANWRILYARGIVHERMDDFGAMERDFRAALELSPNQPDILNYLGYSLVEQRIKLDEALEMIQTAVKENPDSGYIIDSLAWIYYRFGRFEEAVEPMERAVELLPVDPIINDHLGDVYYMVGREREAEFQWKRALSFEPDEKDADRIRDKLKRGLTAVLADEDTAKKATQTAND